MQTHAYEAQTLVPPPLATLADAVGSAGLRRAAALACTDLERWLTEHPLEVPPRETRSSGPLPPVDWLARVSSLTPPPIDVALEAEPLPDATFGQSREIAWAIVLAVQHVAVECAASVSFAALRRAANAILAIEPDVRRGLASTKLEFLDDEAAARPIREALIALGFAEGMSDGAASLRVIAVAAMAQSLLDELTEQQAMEILRRELVSDARCVPEVVTAYEALCIRRGHPPDGSPLHARLVALACEEARVSRIEGRPSSIARGVALVDHERASVNLLVPSMADGSSTLAKIPIAHVVAAARLHQLTATVVLIDAQGKRHAIAFRNGDLGTVHAHGSPETTDIGERLAAIAKLPEDTELRFFWRRDLLGARTNRSRTKAARALLAIARCSDPARMRAEIENLGAGLVVHATIDALAPTEDERRMLQRWNVAWLVGRTLDVRTLTRAQALPLAYALIHLGEAHAPTNRCSVCRRRARSDNPRSEAQDSQRFVSTPPARVVSSYAAVGPAKTEAS